jgi:hypothetical protein
VEGVTVGGVTTWTSSDPPAVVTKTGSETVYHMPSSRIVHSPAGVVYQTPDSLSYQGADGTTYQFSDPANPSTSTIVAHDAAGVRHSTPDGAATHTAAGTTYQVDEGVLHHQTDGSIVAHMPTHVRKWDPNGQVSVAPTAR